ncbi:MAG: LppX_LprAFG lipoprotein [Acidimicrobiales bacterium]|nr:LppX_LprAFG lipoprotein [Acidimicrobiales bacterium]
MAAFLAGCTSGGSEPDPALELDPAVLQAASSEAMGAVTSVRFTLEQSGDPVFIDAADAISLNSLEGRFTAPSSADAVLAVEVSGLLNTKIGAVAIGEEIWLSNPITGEFETLPPGFDIDPSSFFDPKGAWQPLLRDLTSVELVGEADIEGVASYQLRGTATPERMEAVTAGLVRGEEVRLDIWIDQVTALVQRMEFEVGLGEGRSSWVLGFSSYGEPFTITDPTTEG